MYTSLSLEEKLQIIEKDINDSKWKYFYLPPIVFLFFSYCIGYIRFYNQGGYTKIQFETGQVVYENHINNFAILSSQPNMLALHIHFVMAIVWVSFILLQKYFLYKMCNSSHFDFYKKFHSITGYVMYFVLFIGCFAGWLMALFSHNHASMQIFLLVPLPICVITSAVMAFYTAKNGDIIGHRFWANVSFVATSVVTFYTEFFIYILGRYTPLGFLHGELVACCLGSIVWVILVFILYREKTEVLILRKKFF